MSDDSLSHIPPHLIYLAQQIARECARPGTYTIQLTVPAHAAGAFSIEVGRYERIRRSKYGKKRGQHA